MTAQPQTIATGLASIYIQPAQQQKFDSFKKQLLADLRPRTFFETLHFDSILHASWNIQQCLELEGTLHREHREAPTANLSHKLDRLYRDKKMHEATRRQSAAELRRIRQSASTEAPSQPETSPQAQIQRNPMVGRNEHCHCGSGLKFKRCCLISSICRSTFPRMNHGRYPELSALTQHEQPVSRFQCRDCAQNKICTSEPRRHS